MRARVEAMTSHPYSPRPMNRIFSLGAFAAALLTATAAFAQMYPGEGIYVNPNAAYGRPSGPNGPYMGVIHLHMPVAHKRRVVKKAPEVAAPPADAGARS